MEVKLVVRNGDGILVKLLLDSLKNVKFYSPIIACFHPSSRNYIHAALRILGYSDKGFRVGKNKLVSGGYAQAVARIKSAACPPNARRLGLDTPCAATGKCNVAACKTSMCSVVTSFERAPGGRRFLVLLVNEDLGY